METVPLIEALRQGDPQALATIFEMYSDRVYRLAFNLLHDEQSADGVVQDTFVALIEHIHQFEGRAALGTWLYRIAYNQAMGRVRRVRPQVELDAIDDDTMPMPTHLSNWQQLPESSLSDAELREQIDAAIAQLNPTLRSVFWLRDVEELSTEMTAQILGINEGTVKVRLHRARLALREQLAHYLEQTL